MTKLNALVSPDGVFDVQQLEAVRTIWALCDLRKTAAGSVLNVSHFAICLVAGREPMWGLFDQRSGRLQRFYAGRWQIEAAMPWKVWRRKVCRWSLGQIEDEVPRDEIVRRLEAQLAKARQAA